MQLLCDLLHPANVSEIIRLETNEVLGRSRSVTVYDTEQVHKHYEAPGFLSW